MIEERIVLPAGPLRFWLLSCVFINKKINVFWSAEPGQVVRRFCNTHNQCFFLPCCYFQKLFESVGTEPLRFYVTIPNFFFYTLFNWCLIFFLSLCPFHSSYFFRTPLGSSNDFWLPPHILSMQFMSWQGKRTNFFFSLRNEIVLFNSFGPSKAHCVLIMNRRAAGCIALRRADRQVTG